MQKGFMFTEIVTSVNKVVKNVCIFPSCDWISRTTSIFVQAQQDILVPLHTAVVRQVPEAKPDAD